MAYGQANVDTIQSSTAGTPPVFKDGNSTQIGTLCRAWVYFNGNGANSSPATVYGSFNVSSVTHGGNTGLYVINFTNAMPDANYAVVATAGFITGRSSYPGCVSAAATASSNNISRSAPTAGSISIVTGSAAGVDNSNDTYVSIFR